MRKRCTRQHFIEYLGYNYVEKQALLARCIWQRYIPDYSYDGFVRTFAENGELEEGKISFQVKSTDKINRKKITGELIFDLSKRDLEAWLNKLKIVVLVLYDAQSDVAYYVEMNDYFQEHRQALRKVNKFVRVYIPTANVFNPEAVTKLRTIKNSKYEPFESL